MINDDNYKNIKTSSEFIAKYDTKIDTITSVQTDYLRRKFHLNMNEFILSIREKHFSFLENLNLKKILFFGLMLTLIFNPTEIGSILD